ncbi:RNA polymerase sigma factor rpoD [Morus notabilis]|uniref:RNA polymerase sigma factor rpoD n=1 Tax=Morus notabilis TaxID=981085 RepID=W9S522_9ROSA|nr:RNA polymerase sigma factor rpoD [Morus notabilis]
MEVGRNLLSPPPSFPSRTHLRNYLPSSSSASTSANVATGITSMPATSIAQPFSTSVLLQEQRDEFKPLLRVNKEDKTSQGVLNRRQNDSGALVHEDTLEDYNQFVWEFERPSVHWPGFWHVLPSLKTKVKLSSSLTMETTMGSCTKDVDVEVSDAIALAKKALMASKEAASLAEESKLVGTDSDDMLSVSFLGKGDKTVRSTRLLERRSKRRKVPESSVLFYENPRNRAADIRKRLSEGLNSDDPLRLFLAGPETRQLLTFEEESELIAQVQDLIKLEQVKARLQSEFGREPTLVEWAEAVGLSCRILQSQIQSGTSSREKLICANLRLVVHIAKQYQGRGVGIQDLMQEGSMGLMKSVEKFKPQVGCRFASYAYWWIRQTENVYTLLGKVLEAKRSSIQEGNHNPSKEDLATRVGITVEKLNKLLYMTRIPLSMQQPVWADQSTTFQEVTADTRIEIPDVSVAKQMMRQHVRGLLRSLNVRERQIIRLRFGIEDGNQKSLSEIGRMYGLSKERVRQLESRALYKLKQCLGSQDLEAYADLIV